MTRPLTIAAIGCGGRSRTYIDLAAKQPERYQVVAAADPIEERLAWAQRLSTNPEFRRFHDADAILAEPQMADMMIIGTQDAHHRTHAVSAMERGYDLLLEKPIATTESDVEVIKATADRLGRRVVVCHVLRYTPFYRKLKKIVDSGVLGEVVSLNATEGVEAWHQAHSFVRGNWSVTTKSSPMILAKSCHDLDIIRWIANADCQSISSFGSLSHFNQKNIPKDAPKRCMDGCPVASSCLYNAEHYLADKKWWLGSICPLPMDSDVDTLRTWLHESDWGRCVYQCDNDVVDHQTVNMVFTNGLTATFTMTAFERDRHIEIFGTRARLIGGARVKNGYGCDLLVQPHGTDTHPQKYSLETDGAGYDSHLGGDAGIMHALYDEMRSKDVHKMTSSLDASVASHRMAFAAEVSRLGGQTVHLI